MRLVNYCASLMDQKWQAHFLTNNCMAGNEYWLTW